MNDRYSVAEALEKCGFLVHNFKGTSMLPLLVEGRDSVRLVPLCGRLKKGDIALFCRDNGGLVLHRVVRVRRGGYAIRGDNCPRAERVAEEQILAVAEGVYLGGEYHPCSEPEIKRYALRQKLTLPLRCLKYYARVAKTRLLSR